MVSNINTLIRTLLRAAMVASVASTAARGQAPVIPAGTDGQVCADSANAAATYARCALMLEGGVVRRGIDAVAVGRPGVFRPIRLERLVVGDSARMFARNYERRARQGNFLTAVGAALMITGLVISDEHNAPDCPPGIFCEDTRNETAAVGLVIAGAGISVISLPFHLKAQRASVRAIWWNNARFAR